MKHQVAVVEHQRKVPAATRRALRTALAEHGLQPASWIKVPKARKTKAAVAAAVNRGAGTVLVCGGDGTVRAAAEALIDTGVALAVLPTGTANLFASGLDLPTDPAAVIEAIVGGNLRYLDINAFGGSYTVPARSTDIVGRVIIPVTGRLLTGEHVTHRVAVGGTRARR
jgi:diacylglycerol kinase (ATP)